MGRGGGRAGEGEEIEVVSGAGGECRDASERLDSVATLSGEHIEMTVFHCKFWPRSNGRGPQCSGGRPEIR